MLSIETLNEYADIWARFMWNNVVDTTIMLVLVATLWIALRRWMPAKMGYCLFLLVLIKICVPHQITVPDSVAYLSPQHAFERLITWTPLSAQRPSTSRMTDRSRAKDTAVLEEVPGTVNSPQAIHSGTADLASSLRLSVAAKLMCGWSMTVLILFVWYASAQRRLTRVLREATPFERDSQPIDLADLRRLAGVTQPVRLLTSAAVSSPAIGGLLRPCIVLPVGLAATLSAQQMRWVLLHELAHIRRHDLWVAALQRMVQITQFFNPAIWLAGRMIDQQREYACDDAALAASVTSRRECGAAFLAILDLANSQPAPMTSAIGFFSAKHSFRRRLMRILDSNRRVRNRFTIGSTAVLLAMAVLLLPRLQADPQKVSSDSAENPAAIPLRESIETSEDASADGDSKSILGENFLVFPVATELQQDLVEFGPGNRETDARAYVLIDGMSVINKDGTIDGEALNLGKLRESLKPYANRETGVVFFQVFYGLPEGSADELLMWALQGFGKHAGFQKARVSSTSMGGGFSWERMTKKVIASVGGDADGAEPMTGDMLVKVYPVRTSLSRYVTGNSDCVIDILQTIDGAGDVPLKPEILNSMKKHLTKLKLKQRRKVLIRVTSSGNVGREAVEKLVEGTKQLEDELGFEAVSINHTSR